MVFCSLDINDILQGGGVILALALCIGWIMAVLFQTIAENINR